VPRIDGWSDDWDQGWSHAALEFSVKTIQGRTACVLNGEVGCTAQAIVCSKNLCPSADPEESPMIAGKLETLKKRRIFGMREGAADRRFCCNFSEPSQ
jgi:hypothetical protein